MPAPTETSITVEFAGEEHPLAPGDELTFGRGATNDIDVDANPQLHRTFGQILHRDGAWWLRNNGRRLEINVADHRSRSTATLAAGAEISLSFASASITFSAGPTSYELTVAQPDLSDTPAEKLLDDHTETAMTIDQSRLPLVGDQLLLAVALSEPALRSPHAALEIPANKSIAHRFGWSTTTFNRKLDRLCKKFARAGVSGLVGSPGQLATDRRRKLVEHLIRSGTITLADLDVLDRPDE